MGRARSALSSVVSKAELSPVFGVLCSIVLAAILAYPLYCDGIDSFVIFGDEGDSNLPQLMYLKEMIMRQGISFWWYNSVSGTDYFGSAVIIKTNLLLFLLLPSYVAYVLCRYLAYAIGIWSMYVLMRGYFNTGGIVAILAGLLFASHLIYQPLLGHGWSMSLLPLLVYYFCRTDSVSGRTLLLSALYGFLFGLTGNFTQTLYMLCFVLFCCLVFRTKKMRFWFFNLLAFSIMHLVSQIPDILTAFSVAGISHRSEDLYIAVRDSVLSPMGINCDRANLMTYIVSLKHIIREPTSLLPRHLFALVSLIAIFFCTGKKRWTLIRLFLVYFAILYADAFTMNFVQRVYGFCLCMDRMGSGILASGVDTRLWMMKPLVESMMLLLSVSYIIRYIQSIPDLRNVGLRFNRHDKNPHPEDH